MIIFPAIDIKGGLCVRLEKGDFSTAHKVADDPLETAKAFYRAGAEWLHLVDLDGALEGKRVNERVFLELAHKTELKIELGGGIRSMETIEFYLGSGIERLILGSAALGDPAFCAEAVRRFGARIAVGIDAREGFAAASGWTRDSNIFYIELARRMEEIGVRHIIFTDIARDGMLSGPNLEQLQALSEAVSCDITASGGVTTLADIKSLMDLSLYGAICGKALYTGDLDLAGAILLSKED